MMTELGQALDLMLLSIIKLILAAMISKFECGSDVRIGLVPMEWLTTCQRREYPAVSILGVV